MKRNILLLFFLLISCFILWQCDDEVEFKNQLVDYHGIKVLYLSGAPYDMGYEQGQLYASQLKEMVDYFTETPEGLVQTMFQQVFQDALDGGFDEFVNEYSLPEVKEECQGMVDGAPDSGLTLTLCLLYNSATYVLEHNEPLSGFGCSGFIASGSATADGKMIHGRSQDWPPLRFILENPTIFVRKPDNGIPWALIGYPGQCAAITGFNTQKITLELNDSGSELLREQGTDNLQINRRILETAASYEEAKAVIDEIQQAASELLLMADGKDKTSWTFEMAADTYGTRTMGSDGILYITNHYIEEGIIEELNKNEYPDSGSAKRFLRLQQLLEPEGSGSITDDSLYGRIDVQTAIQILRDTRDSQTGLYYELGASINLDTIGNNAVFHSMVFMPETGDFWLAAGIPDGYTADELISSMNPRGNLNPYVGFNLFDMTKGYLPGESNVPVYQ